MESQFYARQNRANKWLKKKEEERHKLFTKTDSTDIVELE